MHAMERNRRLHGGCERCACIKTEWHTGYLTAATDTVRTCAPNRPLCYCLCPNAKVMWCGASPNSPATARGAICMRTTETAIITNVKNCKQQTHTQKRVKTTHTHTHTLYTGSHSHHQPEPRQCVCAEALTVSETSTTSRQRRKKETFTFTRARCRHSIHKVSAFRWSARRRGARDEELKITTIPSSHRTFGWLLVVAFFRVLICNVLR